MTTTNKVFIPRDFSKENKIARENALEAAMGAAFDVRQAELEALPEWQRVHAFILKPYVRFSYTYKVQEETANDAKDGLVVTETIKEVKDVDVLFPLDRLFGDFRPSYVRAMVMRLVPTLEVLYKARTLHVVGNSEAYLSVRKEAQTALQEVFSLFEYTTEGNKAESTRYIAGLDELEFVYVLAFEWNKKKKNLGTADIDLLITHTIHALHGRVADRSYTLGLPTQIPAKFAAQLAKVKAGKK